MGRCSKAKENVHEDGRICSVKEGDTDWQSKSYGRYEDCLLNCPKKQKKMCLHVYLMKKMAGIVKPQHIKCENTF